MMTKRVILVFPGKPPFLLVGVHQRMVPVTLAVELEVLTTPVYLTQVPLFLRKPPLTCTAGVRTRLLLLSLCLTDKTASLSVRVLTLTLSSLTNITPEVQTPVLMSTRSHFAQKSTSLPVPATSPELIMLPCS
mgnify:CR=1 FL=1